MGTWLALRIALQWPARSSGLALRGNRYGHRQKRAKSSKSHRGVSARRPRRFRPDSKSLCPEHRIDSFAIGRRRRSRVGVRALLVSWFLRERKAKRYFRGAKGDTYFPHDAYRIHQITNRCRKGLDCRPKPLANSLRRLQCSNPVESCGPTLTHY